MVLKYATTTQLAKTLKIKKDVPSWEVGATPQRELIGTGNNSTTIFHLDNKNILANSYTISYGATTAIGFGTALTETTHYSLDKDVGKITLTTSGTTTVGTSYVIGQYSYNFVDITDTELNEILARAEVEIDSNLNSAFTDGTTSNPSYPSELDIQPSKGSFDRVYFTRNKPLIDVYSYLAAPLGTTGTTAQLFTGAGTSFPSAGEIVIDNEIIKYAGGSANTLHSLIRGIYDSDAASHVGTSSVHTTIVEVSATEQGGTPIFSPLLWDDEVYVTEDGKVYINSSSVIAGVAVDEAIHPIADIENRFRIRYLYGYNRIPLDITRLALLYAKRMLVTDTISGALFQGRNEFRPEMVDADLVERERIENKYKILPMENT